MSGGGVLEYKRQKTGTPMLIEVQSTAWESLRELSSDVGKDSPYLFPFLKGMKVGKEAYKEYTSALAHFNRNLKRLGESLRCVYPDHLIFDPSFFCDDFEGTGCPD